MMICSIFITPEVSLRVPALQFLCEAVHVNISCWCNFLFFSFSIHFLATHPDLGMIINGKKTQGSVQEAEQEKTIHELPDTEMVKSGNIRHAFVLT